MFFENYKSELIATGILLLVLLIIRFILTTLITKISRKQGINLARIHLINRYVSVTLFLIALIIIPFIYGTKASDLIVLFSSVFAVIGIGLFAIWSILSNITSGIIMFFSFPYKVGDKIQIHDKDFPLEGIIEDIRAFQLHLRLENGDLVTYPNNLMLQKAVTLIEKDAISDDDIASI
ncbi:mechanosensitive ion channel domain-containing protein [Mariniflexile maritimum]|jgi:small-conductance mechanosensitive channel|uniref:mechanosensitive ion channel domain-containing protein n=1 Tax=Mariniflexile maritimum TaxID=2682493 RepID=UPI0012F6D32B|nr:mechanosensitive ion channel domain-containing protein [Mariniflexile maritimum]HMQ43960.1 mechanosensitive ion channel [Mariniflexile sp.]HMR15676.1 mechanosensitive ion channel [Mariniflexile sp.]